MTIEMLDTESYRAWDQYVESRPDSTCYHLRAWQTVARRAYHIDSPFLVARDSPGGAVRGVLPLFVLSGPLRAHVTNGLFGAYGAILADNDNLRGELLQRAKDIFVSSGASHLILKCLDDAAPPPSLGLEPVDSWVIARLSLDVDPERIWSGLRNKIRNCVRKAQRHGLEVRAGLTQLEPFYAVLSENMHDKGSPIYGLPFMRELLIAMNGRADVITLWHGEHVIAGALVIDHGATRYVPFASSRPSSLPMSPNNLLYWEIIRRGCLNGIKVLDFGRSLRGSGPLAFKEGWGATVIPQHTYIRSAHGKTLRIDPKGVDWFVKRWRKLPLPVANAVGPAICKRLAGLI